jgi:hypothetical protein
LALSSENGHGYHSGKPVRLQSRAVFGLTSVLRLPKLASSRSVRRASVEADAKGREEGSHEIVGERGNCRDEIFTSARLDAPR